MADADDHPAAPLIFGEVLFDHFPDGSRVLGGAPFNVAWHLQGFGLAPFFVSAVGADETGRDVLDRMKDWGMRTDGVQVDASHPTGRVTAHIVEGEPAFEIGSEQAYDYIQSDAALDSLGSDDVELIYHGSLALRETASRKAVAVLQRATGAPTFVDLNLREPWWTEALVKSCLDGATWLKLNRDELGTVTGARYETVEACEEAGGALARQCDLDAVIVTLGGEGSLLIRGGASWSEESVGLEPDEVVDTVGAGDAFSAIACIGMIRGWGPGEILRRGNAFAGEICRIRGATTADRSIYDRQLEGWRGA
jgi:fructokinase